MGSETQASIYRWMNDTFPGADPDSPRKSLRLLEEVVELCMESGATPNEIAETMERAIESARDEEQEDDEGWFRPGEIPAEAADVLIVLYGVAGMRGFDLHAEVDRKMAINRARRWAARGDGTGYHIKETINEPPGPAGASDAGDPGAGGGA